MLLIPNNFLIPSNFFIPTLELKNCQQPKVSKKCPDLFFGFFLGKMTEHDEIVDDLEYQLQLAGQAGLDLLEANAELTDRVSELEEIELHSTSLSATLRDEVLQLQHELERTRAGRDRAKPHFLAGEQHIHIILKLCLCPIG